MSEERAKILMPLSKSKSSAVFLMALIIMAMASIAAWITSRSVAVSVRGTEKVIGALADGNLTLDVEEKAVRAKR